MQPATVVVWADVERSASAGQSDWGGGASAGGTSNGSAPDGGDSGGVAGDVCRVDGGEDSDVWSIRVGGSSDGVELTDSDGEDTRLEGIDGDDMGDEHDGDIQSTGETSRFKSVPPHP
jgi:hypothetical protein